jgi:hypothetical protein
VCATADHLIDDCDIIASRCGEFPLGIKMTRDGVQPNTAAQFAGKQALAEVLADLSKEENSRASKTASDSPSLTFSSVSNIDQQLRNQGSILASLPSEVVATHFKLGVSMSAIQRRTAAVTDTRLTAITNTAANLKAQLSELDRLRDWIRKAQLSARGSRRIDHSKERRI